MSIFNMTLDGKINERPIFMTGNGNVHRASGAVRGRYCVPPEIAESHAPDLSHHLFSCLIITGYPSETRPTAISVNPFAGVPHTYKRRISFDTGDCLTLNTEIEFDDHGDISSQFHVGGTAPSLNILGVEPTVEVWMPISVNVIRGQFVMAWRTPTGLVCGVAETEYKISRPDLLLSKVQHRHIEISATGSLAAFTRNQDSKFI